MTRLSRVFANETFAHALKSIFARGAISAGSSVNARILGWKDAKVPIGSKIVGSRRMSVGAGFQSAGRVWFEAVSEHFGLKHRPLIRIGRNFRTSGQTHLSAILLIDIGEDCLFGSSVFISDHGHGSYRGDVVAQSDPHSLPFLRPLISHGRVKVGDRCWLGDNVVLLQGVEVGAGSIIGANSVVTKDVPPGAIAAGVPARVLRTFDEDAGGWFPKDEGPRGVLRPDGRI